MARRDYHHGNLAEALVDAATELIAEEGAHALTLRAAARRAGVSHGAPYRHFADKSSLVAAVAERGFRSLHTAVERARQSCRDDPAAALAASGRAYVSFAADNEAQYRVMFGSEVHIVEHPALAAAAQGAFDELLAAVRDCQQAGVVDPQTPTGDVALVVWSAVHGLSLLLLDRLVGITGRARLPEVLDVAIEPFLSGVLVTR